LSPVAADAAKRRWDCGKAAQLFGESPKVGSGMMMPHGRSGALGPDHCCGDDTALVADLTTLAVIQSLRQAGAALDGLWLDAATAGRADALRLVDAAQAVQRALIALT
jgi:hypothetical protein